MNPANLRASVPPAGNSVLAHRLRLAVAPPWWLTFVTYGLRYLAAGLVGFSVTALCFSPFSRPFDGFTAIGVAAGVAVSALLGTWLARLDPRVFRWLAARVNHAPALASQFRDWNDLTGRLAASPYQVRSGGGVVREQDHVFLGTVSGTRWPVLYDVSRPKHCLFTGATSSGKTHRVMLPAALQLLRRRAASLCVIDLKGDKALFFKLATECRRAGVNFRWVNLDPGSSYVFNPLTQRFFERLSEDAQVQMIAQALGLDGQGRQEDVFFSDLNERTLRRFYRAARPRSFRALLDVIERPGAAGEANVTAREWELAMHLRSALDRLTAALPLNAEAVGPGVTAEMLSGAIDLDDVLAAPEVIYFYLPTTLQRAAGRACARLAVQSLVAAARSYAGPRVPVHVFVDEFQEVIGTAAVDGLLRQARDFGLSFWLACQQLSALRQGQHDSLDSVTGNVALQVHFTATDRTGHEHLIRLSGEASRWLRGEADTADGVRGQLREAVRPRLDGEDVAVLNATQELAAAVFSPHTPLAPFRHAFFLRTGFAMSAREYERYRGMPFPHPTRFTVFNRLRALPERPAEPPVVVAPPPPAQWPVPPQTPERPPAPPAESTPTAAAETPPVSPPQPPPEAGTPPGGAVPPPTPAPDRRGGKPRQRPKGKPPAAPPVPPPAAPNPDLANYLKQLRLEDAQAAAGRPQQTKSDSPPGSRTG